MSLPHHWSYCPYQEVRNCIKANFWLPKMFSVKEQSVYQDLRSPAPAAGAFGSHHVGNRSALLILHALLAHKWPQHKYHLDLLSYVIFQPNNSCHFCILNSSHCLCISFTDLHRWTTQHEYLNIVFNLMTVLTGNLKYWISYHKGDQACEACLR